MLQDQVIITAQSTTTQSKEWHASILTFLTGPIKNLMLPECCTLFFLSIGRISDIWHLFAVLWLIRTIHQLVYIMLHIMLHVNGLSRNYIHYRS